MSTDPNRTVVVASLPSEAEAALVVQSLQSQGVEATSVGGLTSGFRAESPGEVKVLVRVADVEKARTILREVRSR